MPEIAYPTSSPSLRIAILGAGKIGSAFAFQLSRVGGHEVTVIARPGSTRLRQLERDRAIINVADERATVQVETVLDEHVAYDLIIVTLLAHQVTSLLPVLRRSKAGCIQFMFNTFEPDLLQEAIGTERCAFGMPFVQATLTGEGRLKATIGAGGQKTIMNRQRWVDVFNAAGLPAALEPDMPLWLRNHTPFCVAFESVSCAGQRRGGGASWGEAMVIARGVRASFELITTLGFLVYPKSKERIARSPVLVVAAILWGLSRIRSFRELLATGEIECRALLDVMLEAGSRVGSEVQLRNIEAMRPVRKS